MVESQIAPNRRATVFLAAAIWSRRGGHHFHRAQREHLRNSWRASKKARLTGECRVCCTFDFNCLFFKTANGNPLKHKKPHKKTQQNRNRRTHPKRGTHKSHKEGKTKDTTRTKHTNTNTQKHEHPHTQATSPKGHPHPHNDTQTTNQTPYTTTKPHPSDAESARHTTEGRQGVARSPKS
jgi:hypothetical protein